MPVSDHSPATTSPPLTDVPLVESRDITVELGGHTILHDVSTQVDDKEVVALLGGNGSGKTTLIRALLGLVPVSSGEVRLFGTPISDFDQWSKVGYVPQRGVMNIANATVQEVVSSGRLAHRRPFHPANKQDRAAVDHALELVSLTNLRGREMTELSGGQQQRTLIARALASEPELLVLDEPLAGLDMKTQQQLAAIVCDLVSHGLGLLVVLHELGPLEATIDRSIVLQQGRIIHDGPLRSGGGTQGDHHIDHPDEHPMTPRVEIGGE